MEMTLSGAQDSATAIAIDPIDSCGGACRDGLSMISMPDGSAYVNSLGEDVSVIPLPDGSDIVTVPDSFKLVSSPDMPLDQLQLTMQPMHRDLAHVVLPDGSQYITAVPEDGSMVTLPDG